MKKINIMILFLSNISLSGNDVISVDYGFSENGKKVFCQCTNESAVRYMVDKLERCEYTDENGNKIKEKLDWMFVICSKKVLKPLEAKNEDGTYRYTDEEGRPLSQYGFFRKRLLNIIPDFDAITGYNESDTSLLNNKVNYDDDPKDSAKAMDEAMHCVAELSEKIFRRLDGIDLKNVTIHADMSGGFRFISMMLMSVLRLMQYRRIEIGDMLYSNLIQPERTHGYIERTNPIYGLLDMVSGAEEFYKYGSVNILDKYFKEVHNHSGDAGVSEELSNLIDSMKFFADEVRLCHYASMKKAAKDLRDAINKFQKIEKNGKNVNVRERLLGTLTPLFTESYSEFDTDKIDDIVLIKWCLNHDCLQQALTLYFERLYHILVNNKIISFSSKYEQKLRERYDKEKTPEEFVYWCLKKVNAPDVDEKSNASEENLLKEKSKECAKLFIQYVRDDKMKPVEIFSEEINNILCSSYYKITLNNYEQVMSLYEGIRRCKNDPKLLLPGKEDIFVIDSLKDILESKVIMNDEYNIKWKNAEKGYERVKILKGILNDIKEIAVSECILDIQYMWAGYSSRIGHCIESEIYILDKKFSLEDMMRILNNYDLLQQERNNSNHAKENVRYRYNTAADLNKAIANEIEFIERKLGRIK